MPLWRKMNSLVSKCSLCPRCVTSIRNVSHNTGQPKKASEDQQSQVLPFKSIPGPTALPLVGSMWKYIPFIGEYSFKKLQKSYQKMHRQFGPLVREKLLGRRTMVHVFDPEDMMKVYRNESRYPQRRSHLALAKYRKERPSVYKSVGLFPSNGEEWLRFRRLFQKVLMHPSISKTYYTALEEVTDDFIKRIPTILDKKNEVDLQPELFKWALECVGAITLDRRLGCLSNDSDAEVESLVKAAHDTHYTVFVTENSPLYKYVKTPNYKKLVRAQDYLASVVEKYIKEAQSNKDNTKQENSLLLKMLQVPEADFKDVFTMVLDMFLAGIDTTAYTTAFALYNLTRNADVQTKLRDELVQQFPLKDFKMREKMEDLPYLNGLIRESLRINPVSLGNGRVLVEDLVLSNYMVPAGTQVILQHQAASLHEGNFLEPQSFQPERWIVERGEKRPHHPYASAPFGAGPRSCIGRRFALREMMFAIGKIIRRFHIEYHYDDIDTAMRLINVPDKPLRLRFREVEV